MRHLYRTAWVTIFALALPAAIGAAHGAAPPSVNPDDAFKLLNEGNLRYRNGTSQDPHRDQDRRCETFTGGQHPYAIVLACADSRAPVEVIFDAGIGDLFTVRVAGNVASTDEVGSIEYAVEHLGAPLVVVLGHTKCGAVTAVVERAHVSESIAKLVAPIVPAVERAAKHDPKLSGAALVSAAIRENVIQSIHDLQSRSEIVRQAVAMGKLKIVGGIYDLHTGEIQWVDAPQAEATKVSKSSTESTPNGAPSDLHTSTKLEAEEATHEPVQSHPQGESEPKKQSASSAAPVKTRENYAALGGLLVAAAVGSSLAIRFVGGKRRG
jgi:carbonic anhydrase